MGKLTHNDDLRSRPKRRANGAGSVGKLRDGAIDVRVTTPSGSRRRRTVRRQPGESVRQVARRAEIVLKEMQQETLEGQTVASGRVTVAGYAELWLDREAGLTKAGMGLAPATLSFYDQQFRYYINPHLGSRSLPSITHVDVNAMMNSLKEAGRSTRTIQAARNALGRLLKVAYAEGLVSTVATDRATHVRRAVAGHGKPVKALEPSVVRQLLAAAEGTRWSCLLSTLAFLGVRRGEALGLSWKDIDLDQQVIIIERSLAHVSVNGRRALTLSPTKTPASERAIPVPMALVTELVKWREMQDAERSAAGDHWGGGEWASEELVFTTELGTPVDPDRLRRALKKIAKEAGVGHVHPHQLRHSVASLLIATGYTAPEVSRLLGHSSPQVTLEIYAHAFDQATARAAAAMATAVAEHSGPADT